MYEPQGTMFMIQENGNFVANSRPQCNSPLFYPVRSAVDYPTMREHRRALSIDASNQTCNPRALHEGSKEGFQQSVARLSDVHLASRKAEESAIRRVQAASWLERMVGPLDLAPEPSEEELRLCLRNGLVLCNLINKIHPGAVQKVVENPTPSIPPEGPALSAYQYFENVRNFVVAVEEMKLPSFEASDLEKGSLPIGSLGRVVDCILALKSYWGWKQNGGQGLRKFAGGLKSPGASNPLVESNIGSSSCGSGKLLEPMIKSTSRLNSFQQHKRWGLPVLDCPENLSEEFASPFAFTPKCGEVTGIQKLYSIYVAMEGSVNAWSSLDPITSWLQHISQNFPDVVRPKNKNTLEVSALEVSGAVNRMDNAPSQSLLSLVMTILRDKQPEEIPLLVEFMLRKVMEEFEHRLSCQGEQLKSALKELFLREDPWASPQLKSMETWVSTSVDEDAKIEKNREDLKRKFEDPHCARDQQERQERIQALQLELEQFKCMDEEHRYLLEAQKTDVEGLKNAFKTIRQEVFSMQTEWGQQTKTLDVHIQDLAHAAAGYHKVVAENRDLYNQVQDLKGNIRVYCRVRPFLPGQHSSQSSVDFIGENGSLMIVSPFKQSKEQRRMFKFNKIFGPSASQEDVFLDTQPLIRSVLDGYNVCIFAYGQTGSGKTHTMNGPYNASSKDLGVNFRALHDLFEISQSRTDLIKYEVGVQMIEIYNEQVRDLLCTNGGIKKLEIRNNSQQNGVNVPDANMVPVKSTVDVLELMNTGHKNRSVGATALNERSSRSHSVLTVHVQGTDLASGAILRGCLHLVDLAGSERVDKSEAVGDRLKEAQHINKSLSALGDVIAALANKNMHVPYRNSKLTQLLQDSLGGQAKTLMFVHISPDEGSYGETMSTLKFAERVATVELGAAQSNRETGEVRELKEQISWLKDALAKKEAEIERLQKDNRNRGLESVPDKVRLKTGASPLPYRKMNVEAHSQGNRRQPLEEMRNAEVRQSHIAGAGAQKHMLISDVLSERPHEGSQFESSSRLGVALEEDSGKQGVTKTLRCARSPARSSNSEVYLSATSPNRRRNEYFQDQEPLSLKPQGGLLNCKDLTVQSSSHRDVLENVDNIHISSLSHDRFCRRLKPAEGTTESKFVDEVSFLSFQSPQNTCFEGVTKTKHDSRKDSNLQSTSFCQEMDLVQDYSTEDSCGRRAVDDDESSDLSEVEVWQEPHVSPATDQEFTNDKLPPSSGKPHSTNDIRPSSQIYLSGTSVKSDRRKMPAAGAFTRSRSLSLIRSGVEGLGSNKPGGKSTLDAKLAISSEGAVECYAKTTLPRQSNSNLMGLSSKSSKRWL